MKKLESLLITKIYGKKSANCGVEYQTLNTSRLKELLPHISNYVLGKLLQQKLDHLCQELWYDGINKKTFLNRLKDELSMTEEKYKKGRREFLKKNLAYRKSLKN